MLYISDSDSRPAGAAHPLANLWDNGPDPVAMLKHEMQVRRIGLDQFGIRNIPHGAPLSELERTFLPLYLHHRYQLTAAAKMIGGVNYTYAVRSASGANPTTVAEPVPAARQREALAAILATLDPKELAIPDNIIRLIPPTAYGYGSGRSENFAKRTSPMFDPIGAAEIAADLTINGLLEPNRAARTINQNARNQTSPHFRDIVRDLLRATWQAPNAVRPDELAVQRAVRNVVVDRLMELASNPNAQGQVRAVATGALRSLAANLKGAARTDGATNEHNDFVVSEIERFLARPSEFQRPQSPLATPPGDPIGN
jgi:hypothetical protein